MGDRTWFDFSVEIKLIWLLCRWYKLTCYMYAGRRSLVFKMSMEIEFVFVWVVQIDLISVGEIGFDLISVKALNWLGFVVGVENDGFGLWIEINLVLVRGSKLACFLCGDRSWLVFSVGSRNDVVLVFGSKLTWFMWGIEIDLISV